MQSGTTTVHLIFPESIAGETAMDCATTEDLARAARFRFRNDASHWIACRAGLRRILGQALDCAPKAVPLLTSPFGKPVLAPPFDWLHFNLSHCADLALVALSDNGPVGVDVEQRMRAGALSECEMTFCHPDEIKNLPADPIARSAQLLRIWTAKEAVLKAMGTGLSHPPETVHLHFAKSVSTASSDLPLPGIEDLRIHALEHPLLSQHRAALATVKTVANFEIISR